MPGLLIEREILIEAPVEVVWRTITDPDQISQWFADRVELVAKPGGHGYLEFGDQRGWGTHLDRLTTRLQAPGRARAGRAC